MRKAVNKTVYRLSLETRFGTKDVPEELSHEYFNPVRLWDSGLRPYGSQGSHTWDKEILHGPGDEQSYGAVSIH